MNLDDRLDWKTAVGYDGVYEVSNTGVVRSVAHKTKSKHGLKTSPSKVLKQDLGNAGYYRVSLSVFGKKSKESVHRMVAKAFIENPDNKRTVNHLNGNKLDNRVENLEWATHKEQTGHAKDNGLLNPPTGIRSSNGRKTHCKFGHEFNKDNTRYNTNGHRTCKMCEYIRTKNRRAELRQKVREYCE